jgi:hypothetical protein
MNKRIKQVSEPAFVVSVSLVALGLGIEAIARWRRVQEIAWNVGILSGTVVAYDAIDRNFLSRRKVIPLRLPRSKVFNYAGDLSDLCSDDKRLFEKDVGTRQELTIIGRKDLPEELEQYTTQLLGLAAIPQLQPLFPHLHLNMVGDAKFIAIFNNSVATITYSAALRVFDDHEDQLTTPFEAVLSYDLQKHAPTGHLFRLESMGRFG